MTQQSTSFADLRDALNAHFNMPVYKLVNLLPPVIASVEEIEASGIFDHLEGRDAYLAWVAEYKTLVKQAAVVARALKSDRCSGDDNVSATAQERLHWLAFATTVAIHQRRLGKKWSAAQACKLRAKAA